MFLEKVIEEYRNGRMIFTKDILKMFPNYSRAYVFRLLKKAEESNDIVRVFRGVYLLSSKYISDCPTLPSSEIAKQKYISNDGKNVFGVYSGLKLLNIFSVSSQVPNIVEIVTNNEATRKRLVCINGMNFIVRKSRFEITKENANYYIILQLFTDIRSSSELEEFSKRKISEFIKSKDIDKDYLLRLAMEFPAKTMKNMVGSGIIYGNI